MRLADIAKALDCELSGDGSVEIKGISSLEAAQEGDLTFLANARHWEKTKASKASAIIATPDAPIKDRPLLKTDNPYLAFAKALSFFVGKPVLQKGIHPTAVIGEGVGLGEGVSIGAYSVVDEGTSIGPHTVILPQVYIGKHCKVGAECLLYPQVVVRERSVLGDRVILHAGTVIGSDGFGYAKEKDGRHYKILQMGKVVVEDDAEIGANVAVDRATLGVTRIGKGVKIDNLVHVAHNVVVGENTLLLAQVGISGSVTVGKNVILGGQVGVVDHVSIGDNVMVSAQSGIPQSVEPNQIIGGTPAIPYTQYRKYALSFPKLPDLFRQIKELQKRLEVLEDKRDKKK
jgi:UDP-3-O-[3-hydroxymyristoyl] glucosamine N-acyltransferase